MQIFELHTNEGRKFVNSTDKQLRAAMYVYIKNKRAQGYKLSEVVFTWLAIRTSAIPTGEK